MLYPQAAVNSATAPMLTRYFAVTLTSCSHGWANSRPGADRRLPSAFGLRIRQPMRTNAQTCSCRVHRWLAILTSASTLESVLTPLRGRSRLQQTATTVGTHVACPVWQETSSLAPRSDS